jgi:hypothetical protein
MRFRLTVRWGQPPTRYHLAEIEADGLAAALAQAASSLPAEVAATADLAEFRPASEPSEREYLPE